MIVTVASYKGGVGKTTTAVHVARYLQVLAPTVLLDGDPTRNATAWSQRGDGLPFRVAPDEMAAKLSREYTHLVFDTGQRPEAADLQAAAEGSDLLIVPAVPSALDTDGLGQTLRALQKIACRNYCVLLTRVAPDAGKQVAELAELLQGFGAPVFCVAIPRLKAFEKAAARGVTVDQVDDPNASRAWAAYREVGMEMMRWA